MKKEMDYFSSMNSKSSSSLNETKEYVLRRRKRKWNSLEEETLRKAVARYVWTHAFKWCFWNITNPFALFCFVSVSCKILYCYSFFLFTNSLNCNLNVWFPESSNFLNDAYNLWCSYLCLYEDMVQGTGNLSRDAIQKYSKEEQRYLALYQP